MARASARLNPLVPSGPCHGSATAAAAGACRAVGVRAGAGRARRQTLILYLDAGALEKRYVAEPGTDAVRSAMRAARGWYMCRVGFGELREPCAITFGQRARPLYVEGPYDDAIAVIQTLMAPVGSDGFSVAA